MNRFVSFLTLITALALTSACAPRGETSSMDELLSQSRDRFRSAESKLSDSPIKGELTQVSQKLSEIEHIQDPTALKPATAALKTSLGNLLVHSSYTVRPSFTEIVDQYGAIAGGSTVTTDPALAGSPEIRLLLVRTYSILATELETGKFSL